MRGLFLILMSFLLINCNKDPENQASLISKKSDAVEKKDQTKEEKSEEEKSKEEKSEEEKSEEEKSEYDPSEFSGP